MIGVGDVVLVSCDGVVCPLLVQSVDAQGVVAGLAAIGGGLCSLSGLTKVTSADKLTDRASYIPKAAA